MSPKSSCTSASISELKNEAIKHAQSYGMNYRELKATDITSRQISFLWTWYREWQTTQRSELEHLRRAYESAPVFVCRGYQLCTVRNAAGVFRNRWTRWSILTITQSLGASGEAIMPHSLHWKNRFWRSCTMNRTGRTNQVGRLRREIVLFDGTHGLQVSKRTRVPGPGTGSQSLQT